MKTLLSRGCSAALLTLVAGASPAVAQVYEGFSYAPGAPLTVVGNGGLGWTGNWNLAGGGDWTIDSIGSTYSSGGKVLVTGGRRIIAANAATQRTMSVGTLGTPGTTAWVSFIAQQTSGPSAQSWTGVKLPCTGPNAFLFLGKPYGKANWGTDAGSIASHKQSTIPAVSKAFIVARIDFKAGADDVYVWVNPGLNSAPTTGSAAVNAPAYGDFSGITKVVTEVGSLGGLITSNIDEIRVGDTFGAVAPKKRGFLWHGLAAEELGEATLNPNPDGTLALGHIGGTGNDGVRVQLGAAKGARMTVDVGDLSHGHGTVQTALKDSSGGLIGTETARGMGNGNTLVVLDFSAIGATSSLYRVLDAQGNVLASGETGGGPAYTIIGGTCPPGTHAVWSGYWQSTGQCCPTEIWRKTFMGCESDNLLQGPWGVLMASSIEFSPVSPAGVGEIGSIDVMCVNTADLTMLGVSTEHNGVTATGLENAILENTSPDMLTVSNIGGTGNDGVRIAAAGSSQISASLSPSQCLSNNGVGRLTMTSKLRMASGEVKSLRCIAEPVSDTRMKLTFDASELGSAAVLTVGGTAGGTGTGGGSGDPQSIIIYIDGMYWGTYDHIPFWVYYFLRTTVTNPTGNGPGTVTVDNNGTLSSFQADALSFEFSGVEQPVAIDAVEITGGDWAGELTISGQGAVLGCPADFNHDGFLDFFDVDAYIAAFEAGESGGDFNGDGFIDFFDIDAFNQAFEAGC